ncbi:glycosyltransferase [Desulfosporosinus acidiphilus SJ4]|uniref:Glycosyltransferase n=1 Tax=Desulfosporosinus acidiphilus (strain DSM 22704 / JCM 16185 / SJ4) TaxID=646529 RepID=I4DCC7_DESAJ|nr:glycosyltransferase family 4 protein [Desulfosporosinus acidiphilus]AFM43451.1 glycosyltransferase [Desulfosporosinus acidiphilus SJ4]
MKTFKILHMIGGGEIGGAEQHVLTLLQNLDPSQFRPSLICLTQGPFAELAEPIIPTQSFIMRNPLDLSLLPSLMHYLRQQGIDLIHTHGSRANFLGRISAKLLKLPNVTTVHSSLAHDYLSPWSARLAIGLDRLTLPMTSKIITVSHYLSMEVSSRGGKHLTTIYNGQSPLPFIDSSAMRVQFREQWGIPKDAFVLGTIGRLHPTKGHVFLCRAASQLVQRFPKLHLLIIGEGPLRSTLEAELQNTSLPYTFAGFLPQAYRALPAMDIFMLPSISEGMGLVLLEAMQMGVPIVASEIGGIPEVVRSKKEALLVPPGNVSELINACTLLIENPELAKSLVSSGQRRWPLFSVEEMVRATEEIYKSLLC